jgi:hypothetical protein
MQYIKDIPNLNTSLLGEITTKILTDESLFNHSLLYDPKAEEKILDPSMRNSEFRLFTEKTYFDLLEKYINIINENDPDINFILLRNDLTHIRYQPGGFFKPHEDYLSFNSNLIEEYTMILCLKADSKGGETIIHVNHFFKHISKSTITPGHALIFRKDLTHEGALLESGNKEILTMNLLAISKKVERTVVVSFPENKKEVILVPLANIEQIPNNYILTKLQFTNEINSKNNLLKYVEEHSTMKEFEIINKIFQKQKLTLEEIQSNYELLDYYQVNVSNIMSKIILNDNSVNKVPVPKTQPVCSTVDFESNFKIYGDESEFQYFLEIVKEAQLPLIPFKMIWMEGDCNGCVTSLSVGAILFSEYNNVFYLRKLGVYHEDAYYLPRDETNDIQRWTSNHFLINDNINNNSLHYFKDNFFVKKVVEHNDDEDENEDEDDEDDEDEEDIEEDEDEFVLINNDEKFYLNFMDEIRDKIRHNNNIGKNNENTTDKKISNKIKTLDIIQDDRSRNSKLHIGFNVDLYLELDSEFKKLLDSLYISDKYDKSTNKLKYRRCHITIPNSQYQGKYYNIDNEGKLGLEYRHLTILKNRIEETNLIDEVKEMIPELPIKCLQSATYDVFMCNEQVYGTVNLVAVYGFLKME